MSSRPNLLRRVTSWTPTPNGADLTVAGYDGTHLRGGIGWLTGEDPHDQGIELTMPNLPDLELPESTPVEHRVRVEIVGDGVFRLRSGPPDDPTFAHDGTRFGIVTTPQLPAAAVHVESDDDIVRISSGDLLLELGCYPFRLAVSVAGKAVLRTSERLRQVAGLPTAPPLLHRDGQLTISFELQPDEDITGFGEQFSRLVKNGQQINLRVEDALGTGTGLAYKPVPVWHSSRGYLGFLNTGATVSCDVGHSMPSVLALTNNDPAIDLYVVTGDTYADRLRTYTQLTGRAPAPPIWAFGYWMGRCRYHSAAEMIEVADTMRQHQVPCDVLHLDPDWLIVDRLNTDFIWNESRFGNRRQFISDLGERGVRLSLWELPYMDPASPRYQEAEENGYLVKSVTGGTAHLRGTPTPDGRPRALLDFSNPDAKAWWQGLHAEFLDDGVAVFKTDFGEGLPDDAALFDGTPPHHAHNLYPLKYNGAVSEGIGKHLNRAPLVWGRSGWAGSQRYPGQWGGDAESTVVGMQATARGGLSYAVSAPSFWSHDIGGFFGPELTPALYVRWTQFGALSPLMRAHGLRPREPWAFGPEALKIAQDWIRLRYSLLPYLWNTALESADHGWPMLRPLDFHDPSDRISRSIDDAFLLGRALLVAPVFSDSPDPVRREFYVPPGTWTDLVSGRRAEGPGYVTWECPLEAMPLLVRDGTVLPRIEVKPEHRNTDDLLDEPWRYDVFGAVTETAIFRGFRGESITWQPPREEV